MHSMPSADVPNEVPSTEESAWLFVDQLVSIII